MAEEREEQIQVAGVRLPRPIYDEVVRLANDNGRTIVGQVAWLVRWAIAAQAQEAGRRGRSRGNA